ncbi:protein SENSITIVITY TO RED LIGHT REDUCED 1-like [Oryza glaberrima]|uniref:protein SENSITIVITY TO RED LIGHT REDUCED 1-like n=1 Tax=Oryza glaberrima TaxID=4538 RepID=UPI00224C58A5|nr:protein SENSITIVITY TO RED LIGHT REDUCED 1-like [Oryza glaberrima]
MERRCRLARSHLLLTLHAATMAAVGPARSCFLLALHVVAVAAAGTARGRLLLDAMGELALTALLRCDLLLFPPESSAHADLFNPVLSSVECTATAALGFSLPGVNDGYRRRVDEPILFYMPHCEASLYDALLAANWEPPSLLRHVCMMGNSFHNYAIQAEENRSGPATKAKHVLAAEQF